MERGDVWWALVDERCPVVILSECGAGELRAVHIVAPATVEEKRGFVVLTGDEVVDLRVEQVIAAAQESARAVGVEVRIGAGEGLPYEGAVRVGFPRDGQILCTWLVTLTRDCLVERAGALSGAKLQQLDTALRLAGIE